MSRGWPDLTKISDFRRLPDKSGMNWASRSIHRLRILALIVAGNTVLVSGSAVGQTEDQQYTTEAIVSGAELYFANCMVCHGARGDAIAGVNLSEQLFKRARSDDDIRSAIRDGAPAAGMPAFRLLGQQDLDALLALIRSGLDDSGATIALGDADRGRRLFEGKGDCTACHFPRGDGPYNAPSLYNLGLTRLPASIRQALLDPASALLPINRPVRIVTRDGRTLTGVRVNQDTYSVFLLDQDNRLVSLPINEIREFDVSTVSAMPSYAGNFTDAEFADLMAYLISLRGN